MSRKPYQTMQVLAGIGAMTGFFVVWTLMFPPVAPPAPAPMASAPKKPSTASHHRASATRTVSPQALSSGPFGFQSISYAGWNTQLTRQGHESGITVLLPKAGPVGTTVEESYHGPGPMVTIQYNNMIVMESSKPMTPYYQPVASTATSLRNGVPAVWDEVVSEGGPPFRLLFHEDGTYVRIQLFHAQIPDTLAEATDIASMFQPLG